MPHVLELFSAGCPLCVAFRKEIEAGKCGPCQLRVIDVQDPASQPLVARYGIRAVPTLVIDSEIRVTGALDEPWVCDDDFYTRLRHRFAMPNTRLERES